MLKFIAQFIFCLLATGVSAEECKEIRFASGKSSAVVSGRVIEASPMCLTFSTGAGQTARLDQSGSDNACFTIEGVVDCQESYSFRTDQQTYRFRIFQLFPRSESEVVSLRLSIN